jgi:flagellar basal body-associated protein FliL
MIDQRKDYKEILSKKGMKKRGQVAIFVIVAIVIVVGGIIVYFLFPNVVDVISGRELEPESYLRSEIEPEVFDGIERLSVQGGYANPEVFCIRGVM